MKVKIIELPKITDPRCNLTFLQNNYQIPFLIKRIFWIYDVPGGETRGGHAYNTQFELIVALSGSFDVVVYDGISSKCYNLNRSYNALLIPPKIWRHMENFSTNALSMHISNMEYDPDDYIWDKNNL
jgi:dTDP-4-dehydrorhamnose 3,5-epimerase-like enzyme